MFLNIIVFVLVIGLLIIAHELGHFTVAKLFKIKVEEFAFGFPPTIWKKKKGDTNYLINLLPIGGYVKMLGEEENVLQPRSYTVQPTRVKIAVIVAGVVMNLILAWFLLSIGFAIGMAPILSSPDQIGGERVRTSIIIAEVKSGSAAETIGLMPGDQLEYIINNQGEKQVLDISKDISNYTVNHRGQEITIGYSRESNLNEVKTILGQDATQPLGIAAVDNSIVRVPWYRAPLVGLTETGKIFKLTYNFIIGFFTNIFVHGQVSKDVGGPVAIYLLTGTAIKMGFMAVLQFIAILSVNLALINILPLPALDGGKILFLILRRSMGKYFIEEKVENIIHLIGLFLLIALMILVTLKDIAKLI